MFHIASVLGMYIVMLYVLLHKGVSINISIQDSFNQYGDTFTDNADDNDEDDDEDETDTDSDDETDEDDESESESESEDEEENLAMIDRIGRRHMRASKPAPANDIDASTAKLERTFVHDVKPIVATGPFVYKPNAVRASDDSAVNSDTS